MAPSRCGATCFQHSSSASFKGEIVEGSLAALPKNVPRK